MTPMVTLYHFDMPQPLKDLGGWPNPLMVVYFTDYARLAYATFGDRIKFWITFNEPNILCTHGYGKFPLPPGIAKSGIGDYLCGHTLLKAHAQAYRMYVEEFRPKQKGELML